MQILFEIKVCEKSSCENNFKFLAMSVELRKEKQKRKDIETELSEYKQLIAKSDNNKLIAMATKVELLTNQLNMAIERTNSLHKKTIKENGLANEENYLDSMKQKIEVLEKKLSEAKAAEVFKTKKQDESNGQQSMPTADEVKIFEILCLKEGSTKLY